MRIRQNTQSQRIWRAMPRPGLCGYREAEALRVPYSPMKLREYPVTFRDEPMTSTEIATMWKRTFGDFAPLGYVCRHELRERWLRIHSLPASKRYPDTETEYGELLRRHNEVATIVLGEGEECALFVTTFGEQCASLAERGLPVIDHATFVDVPELATEQRGERISANVAVAWVSWKRTHFDFLIRSVADESAGGVLFANFRRHTAYAPYDGGADVFVDTPEQVALKKKQWSGWLSPRKDGL